MEWEENLKLLVRIDYNQSNDESCTDNILLVDHLLVVQLQGSEVLPCLRELALLHALAHEPEESKK